MISTTPSSLTARRGLIDRRLFAQTRSASYALAASVSIGLVSTACIAAQALLLARLLASVFPGSEGHPSRLFCFGGIALAAFIRALCSGAGEIVAHMGANRVKKELRGALIARSFGGGESAVGSGELATLAGRGLDALDNYIGRCMPNVVLAVAAPALLFVILVVTDWVSGLIVLAVLGLFPVFGMLVGWTTSDRARRRWQDVSALGDHLVDLFEGLPVLKAFGRAADERARIEEMGEALRKSSLDTLKLAFLSALVLDTLASIAVALVAVPIGIRLIYGSMALTPGLAALLLTPEVFMPPRRASADFHESAEGLAAVSRVLDLLGDSDDTETEPHAKPRHLHRLSPLIASSPDEHAALIDAPDPSNLTVSLCRVSVVHDNRRDTVLDHASLDIAPRETVVLIGANGAGKSTILSVILGMSRPSEGRVTIGTRELHELSIRTWRQRCSYLSERATLLSTSLEENLRIANPCADEESMRRALADACCLEIVEALPRALLTEIGEGGWSLSAGEQQRVCLARTLLRDAGLYLLDEPTAHLDATTEARVIERLRTRLSVASACIVTHRSAVLALADRILEVRDGHLVEIGQRDAAAALESNHGLTMRTPSGAKACLETSAGGAFL